MSIYDELVPVARELLKEFKQGTIKLVQITPGNGTPDDPGPTTETETVLDAVARGAPYKFIQNGFAVASDLMVTAATIDGITLSVTDFIEIDGIRYKVVQILPVPSAGTKVVWKFIIRKGA